MMASKELHEFEPNIHILYYDIRRKSVSPREGMSAKTKQLRRIPFILSVHWHWDIVSLKSVYWKFEANAIFIRSILFLEVGLWLNYLANFISYPMAKEFSKLENSKSVICQARKIRKMVPYGIGRPLVIEYFRSTDF